MKSNQHVSAREVLEVLFRHRKKMVFFFVAVTSLLLLGLVIWPRTYVSEAKLFVRVGRETVGLDPTATTGQTVHVSRSEQTGINTVLQMLESRRVAERVVDELGIAALLHGENESPVGDIDSYVIGLRGLKNAFDGLMQPIGSLLNLDPISEREAAIGRVQRMTRIGAPKETTIVSITCNAQSPKLAQRVCDAMLRVFLDEYIRLNRTTGSYEFFEQQKDALAAELREASGDLRDRKNQFQLLTVEGRRAGLEQVLSDLRIQTLHANANLVASQAKVSDLTAQLETMSKMVVTSEISGIESQAQGGKAQTLFEYEGELKLLQSKYNSNHHEVKRVKRQIEQLKELLKEDAAKLTQQTKSINPNYQQLELLLAGEKSQVQSWRSQSAGLHDELEKVTSELRNVNDQAVEIEQLERRVYSLTASYQSCLDKLEQARLDKELDERKISNINVVQPASFVGQPDSPNKKLSFMIGICFALCGSFGLMLVAEAIDQSVKTSEQVENVLGLPVLVSIPATRSHRLPHLNGRQKWLGSKQAIKKTGRASKGSTDIDELFHGELIH